MGSVKLICPYNPQLLDRFHGRILAVRVKTPGDVAPAAHHVRLRNELLCVIFNSEVPLDGIEGMDEWKGIPVALMAPSFGKFRNIVKKLELMRDVNLRVYLSCEKENLTGAMMLASVGVPCAVAFDGDETPDWEALSDLMTYAVLGRVHRANIEPFNYIAENFNPQARAEWGRINFEDPNQYLHLDSAGRVALSRRELLAENFIAQNIDEAGGSEGLKSIEERLQKWRGFFLANHFCSRCEAWRICGGKFAQNKKTADGCSAFFSEMMTVAKQYQDNQRVMREDIKWQP